MRLAAILVTIAAVVAALSNGHGHGKPPRPVNPCDARPWTCPAPTPVPPQ